MGGLGAHTGRGSHDQGWVPRSTFCQIAQLGTWPTGGTGVIKGKSKCGDSFQFPEAFDVQEIAIFQFGLFGRRDGGRWADVGQARSCVATVLPTRAPGRDRAGAGVCSATCRVPSTHLWLSLRGPRLSVPCSSLLFRLSTSIVRCQLSIRSRTDLLSTWWRLHPDRILSHRMPRGVRTGWSCGVGIADPSLFPVNRVLLGDGDSGAEFVKLCALKRPSQSWQRRTRGNS